jgi:gliding motility-associated protein GldM
MGATNCPETPRQKMISMMYLVLTAMLALNVSIEILHGYSLVDGSLRKSINIADKRNASLNTHFENLVAQNREKTQEWKDKADLVIKESEALYDYVTVIKRNIIGLVDGVNAIKKLDKDGKPLKGPDGKDIYKDADELEISDGGRGDLNITGQVGTLKIGHTVDGVKYDAAGPKLKKDLEEYSKFLQSLVTDSVISASIASSFSTDGRYSKEAKRTIEWAEGMFDNIPAIATLTLLSKIQNDIRNTESQILQYLINQIDAGDFRVNKIEALVIPNSKYVVKGNKYHAQIVLSASDSTKALVIEVGGRPLEKGIYEVSAGTLGKSSFSGVIKMQKPNSEEWVSYPFKDEYTVGEPSATISADRMNVFYAGIDNPLSVSVPGVAASDVEISVANGTAVKIPTGWDIRPAKVGVNCVISVTAKFDGKPMAVASKEFRVKPLPPPLAKLEYLNGANKEKHKGGTIAKNLLITATRVIAELDDDDLDVKYKVLSFSLNYTDSMGNTLVEQQPAGGDLTPKQLNVFKQLVKGRNVYITNVKAMGPDNIKRDLPPVEIALK